IWARSNGAAGQRDDAARRREPYRERFLAGAGRRGRRLLGPQHGVAEPLLELDPLSRQLDADETGGVRLRGEADEQGVDLLAVDRLLLEQGGRQHVEVLP